MTKYEILDQLDYCDPDELEDIAYEAQYLAESKRKAAEKWDNLVAALLDYTGTYGSIVVKDMSGYDAPTISYLTFDVDASTPGKFVIPDEENY
jgi:hypothetical protein